MMNDSSKINNSSDGLISPLVITKLNNDNSIQPIYDVNIITNISDYLVHHKKYRDNLLFIFACNSPVSIKQLRLLKISDLFTNGGELKDIIQFDGEEFILSKPIKEALQLHLNHSHKMSYDEYLFTSESGNNKANQPISCTAVDEILKKISNEFGFLITLYTLKRTYLFHAQNYKCFEKNVDSEPIKKHSDIKKICDYLVARKRYRDNMLFIIGINTGLRISKLRLLKFSDFFYDDGKVKDKIDIELSNADNFQNKVCAYIPINDSIISAISLYRSENFRRQMGEYLFVSESGNGYGQDVPVSRQAVANFIERLFKEVDIDINASDDVFRKTFVFQQLVISNNSPKVITFFRQALNFSTEDQVYSYVCSTPKEIEKYKYTNENNSSDVIVSTDCDDLQQLPLTPDIQEPIREQEIDFQQYKEILAKDYKKGFRLNDKISTKRLRIQWQKTFNEDLQYDDETIYKHISHITIRHGDMAYLPESMLSDESKNKLIEHINNIFAEGKSVIYYEALYREFSEEFAEGRINNVDMLKTYLAYINNGKFYLRRSYIAADENVEADNNDEVRSLMISHGAPMQTDDIVASLSHIAKDKVMWVVAGPNSSEFVRNKKGEYFHADIIEFTQNEMDLITEWISSAIDDKVYMGGKELVDTINQKLPSIKERYPFLTWLGLRDVVAYKLRDVFSFNGKIISTYGENLSMSDVFSNYAMKHEHFTLTQLNMLKDELGTPIYYDSLFKYAVRINENEFVSKQRINFDISATDDAIEQFCQGEFISLKDVSLFGGFPDVSFPWNHFLLQQFVAYYSKKFMLLHNGFNAGKPVGAIVKRSSQIDTFDDVIIRVLSDSNIPLNSENALQYLCDTGYIARKSYSTIDSLLSKANIYRANKGE